MHLITLCGDALPEAARYAHQANSEALCVDDVCKALMKTVMRQLKLTARACHRVLKFYRPIEDLVGSEMITQVHLA